MVWKKASSLLLLSAKYQLHVEIAPAVEEDISPLNADQKHLITAIFGCCLSVAF